MIPNIPAIKNPEKFIGFDLPREKVEAALAEAYKKGGTLFLTATFAKYNSKAIANLEARLKELGEELPVNPGSNITPGPNA